MSQRRLRLGGWVVNTLNSQMIKTNYLEMTFTKENPETYREMFVSNQRRILIWLKIVLWRGFLQY